MFKLFFTLVVFLGVALALLGLRHRRLELTAECVRIHDEIQAKKQTLWGQVADISRETNPVKLAQAMKDAGMDVPESMVSRTTTRPSRVIPRDAVETDLTAPVREPAPQAGGGGRSRL